MSGLVYHWAFAHLNIQILASLMIGINIKVKIKAPKALQDTVNTRR